MTNLTFDQEFPFTVNLTGVELHGNDMALAFIGILLVVGLVSTLMYTWGHIFYTHLRHITVMSNPDRQQFWARNNTTFVPWLKKHLLYAPIWKNRHNKELHLYKSIPAGTLPGRNHFLLIIIYVVFNLVWMLHLPFGEPTEQVAAALRGRSGTLAVFNLFPTIVFALRNNPFISILHVPFDTFQLFHRWAARLFVIEAIIHTFAWLGNTLNAGGWDAATRAFTESSHGPSFAWAAVGTVAGFCILIQSWSPLRHSFYEVFLFGHKFLVLLVLIGVALHLKLDNLPQRNWLIGVFMLWIYEYVARYARIIYYNVSIKRSHYISTFIIEALEADACRVTVTLPNYWRPGPGAHVHIWLPQLAPLQTHPFSVAWATVNDNLFGDNASLKELKLPMNNKDIIRSKLDARNDDRTTTISLVCRARTGFTRMMHDTASKMPHKKLTTNGYLEGFYGGHHETLASYSDILLFAGGVGITHQLMFTERLLEEAQKGTVAVRKVVLCWTAPDKKCLEWVRPWMNQMLAMPGRRDLLQIKLYVTRGESMRFISDSGSVSMMSGRCDPQQVIDDVLIERSGAMCVTVCGPGAFSDGIRTAVRKRVQVGVLDFIEEAFTY